MESGLNFEKLTSENYAIWRHRMKALLITKGFENALLHKEHENSEQALALMCLCVLNDYVDLIAQSESANSAWSALEAIHVGQTTARRLSLRKELTNLNKNPNENMIGYIMRAKHICTSLKAIDGTITETQLMDAILAGLPEEYSTKVEMLATMGETNMLNIQNQLLHAESSLITKETSKGQVVFAAQTIRPKPTCSYCGRSGHGREKCWYLNGLPKHLQKQSSTDSENDQKLAFVTCALNCQLLHTPANAWVLDSGATTHVCSNENLFHNGLKDSVKQQIFVGNGEIITAEKSGCIQITPGFELKDVLYCPQLKVNLLSVNKLLEDGFDVYFSNDECSIWKGKKRFICTPKFNNLFLIYSNQEKAFSAVELHKSWHTLDK